MALLHAGSRRDYRALCLWAPMHRVALFGEESLRAFDERGSIESPLASGATLRLDRDIIDDAREHGDELDIAAACSRISAPCFLVYGARDPLHTKGGRADLERSLSHNLPKVEVIEKAGHAFGARHPLDQIRPVLNRALSDSVAWLGQQLGSFSR